MKKSHKIILSVAAICLLGVCVWLGCRAFMRSDASERSVPLSQMQAVYDPALRVPAQGSGIGVLSGGDCCQLSTSGVLRVASGTVQSAVTSMLPADDGVLYTVDRTLFYAQREKSTKIAENVTACTAYSGKILYCTTERELFSYESGRSTRLTVLPDDAFTRQIFAWEDHVVLTTSGGIYVSGDGGDYVMADLLYGTPQQFFMYGDYLVIVGDGPSGAIVYDVQLQTVQELDLGWYACEHNNQIAVASDGQWLYLSLYSEIWPQFDREFHTATYRIDPKTWTAEQLSAEFYPGLVCGKDALYGIKKIGATSAGECILVADREVNE